MFPRARGATEVRGTRDDQASSEAHAYEDAQSGVHERDDGQIRWEVTAQAEKSVTQVRMIQCIKASRVVGPATLSLS